MSPLVFAQVPIGGACEVLALLSLLTLIFLAVAATRRASMARTLSMR